MSGVKAFLKLGRPHFLFGGFVLYGLGATIARSSGQAFSIRAYLWGQAAITAFQLMTHYANDYFDFAADVANATPTRFSGGSRVLPAGGLPRRVALVAALVLACLGLAVTFALAFQPVARAHEVALVLVAIAILAWAYSAPPFALHSRGLGELTTAVIVTGLTPWIGYRLQGGETPRLLFVALLPLMLLQFNMLLTIELPDAAGDRQAGKRTLVVRFGPAIAALASQGALISVYAWLPLLIRLGLPTPVALSMTLGLPVAAWQWWRLSRRGWARPAEWDGLAFRSVALLVGTATIELVAFLILRAGVVPR